MPDQANKHPPASMAPEVKRELISLLVENGMDPDLVDMLGHMQPYKIQLFDRIYQGYGHRPDYIIERARELLHVDMNKPHIKRLLEKDENKSVWDEEKFLEFAFKYYRKALALEFIKTEMHEYMNSLASSSDRSSFIVASQPGKVRIV